MKVGFLGFGEAAQAFQEGLAGDGVAFLAYDIKLSEPDTGMRAAMAERNVMACYDIAGLAEADWIFSAVTADQSLLAVEPLLPHLRQGQLVIASPTRPAPSPPI